MKSGIYKIESPSGKIYIGQSVDVEKRTSSYKKIYVSRNQKKLNNSFKKYGVENHLFSFIEQCEIDLLNERERYWQDFFNCIGDKGLNLKLQNTNEKKQIHSQEVLNKISEKMKLKHKEIEYRDKMINSRKGKKLSEKAILSMHNRMQFFNQKGFKNNNAKLTQEIYDEIKKDRELGMTYSQLKSKYNLKSNGHLCNILKSQ